MIEDVITGESGSWVIRKSPIENPRLFTARLFFGERETTAVFVAPTLEEVRLVLRIAYPGLKCTCRAAHDSPEIVETWA